MKRSKHALVAGLSCIVLAGCGATVPSTSQGSVGVTSGLESTIQGGRRACAQPNPQHSECNVRIEKSGLPAELVGWGPSDLQAAYNLPSTSGGSGQTVAIVDAYDNPNVASDLAAYRSYYGLPVATFSKFNQEGQQGNYPSGDTGWGSEIDLDVEMVSAVCPNCAIDLIEANDDSDLGVAEKTAAKLGVHIISNSWSWGTVTKSQFDTPGIVYVAASGDSNYGSVPPADFSNVVSVGGTILAKRGNRYREIVWPFTGGGCASKEKKPAWQHDPSCLFRTQNDVAAVALDVALYDTYGSEGWVMGSGTSVSSPIIAGIYGLAGNASSQRAGEAFWALSNQQRKQYLHAIDVGSDGNCGGSYLCTAGTKQYGTYSGPAGWGTPKGIGAF
jgi:hypothetical protein